MLHIHYVSKGFKIDLLSDGNSLMCIGASLYFTIFIPV